MGGFSELQVWREPATARALSWYRDMAENRMPAKFRIAATIPVAVSLDDASEEALWRELEALTPTAGLRRVIARARQRPWQSRSGIWIASSLRSSR